MVTSGGVIVGYFGWPPNFLWLFVKTSVVLFGKKGLGFSQSGLKSSPFFTNTTLEIDQIVYIKCVA